MPRSLKLKNNDYIDSGGVSHNRQLLSNVLNSLDNRKVLKSDIVSTVNITANAWNSVGTSTFNNVPLGYYFVVTFIHTSAGANGAYQLASTSGLSGLLSTQTLRGGSASATGNTNIMCIVPIEVTDNTVSFTHQVYFNGATTSNSRNCFLIPINM